ncbi:MAG: Na+/glucose cotransporter, partial [Muribaculaceae bacterium]|nr:Na+/glucose cotransporter [Muribaculaceae bacterium]
VYYSNQDIVAGTTADPSLFQRIFYEENWLFFCGWMLLFCLAVGFVVSLFTKAPEESKIRGLVFGTSTPEQRLATRQSWRAWDIIHSIIILGITVAFYIYFW